MKNYLFLFSIGPVQSFISQARKTQDLYAGSFILSTLINSVMKKIQDKKVHFSFVFPHDVSDSNPNRFVIKISVSSESEVIALGTELEKFVKEQFIQLVQSSTEKASSVSVSEEVRKIIESQASDFLQVFWTAVLLDKNSYSDSYNKLESQIGSIKNVRSFEQLNEGNGEIGRKCSLCGERNVVFYRLNDREKSGLSTRKDGLLAKLYIRKDNVVFLDGKDSGLKKGEGLCSICFAKRYISKDFTAKGAYNKNFPSTAEVALMEWLHSNKGNQEVSEYKRLFGSSFDPELFYKENLTENYFIKNDYPVEKLQDAIYKLNDIMKEKNPPKYYALIMSDGDHMGKWLSGDYLKDKNRLEEFHSKMSAALLNYAKKMKDTIKPPNGALIYAGGDDVMAFVNLSRLFNVLNVLRDEFPRFEDMGFKVENNCRSTVSAGVVIAHYKTPLSEVLKWARQMEKEAKELVGRDAFAVAVMKHSGEINKTAWKWKISGEDTITVIENLLKELNNKNEGFSDTFIRNFGFETETLGTSISSDAIRVELIRLLKRSFLGKSKEIKYKKSTELGESLSKLFVEQLISKGYTRKDNFVSLLNILDFVSKGGK